ncbi:hypothetical protein N431DRAFT_495200 [Stipitochalara longipes BDJ]|nr:hypothetical protein N431DRAFT_495200 [Stipitochalara longipes BDJ]
MVGVVTKNRCDNCRKRKKKCDEKKPACSQCLVSGWTCPGYNTPWKFIDETTQLAKHYANRKYVYDVIDLELEAAHRRDLGPGIELDAQWEPSYRMRNDLAVMCTNLYVPRHIDPNPLGTALIFCMGSKVEGLLIPLHLVGSFFDFIPARMGFNNALDDVVSCLCSIYSRKLSTPYGYQRDVYQSYIKALASLRVCLEDPGLRMKSETLCASILLQMCELIVNIDRGEWSQLARGTHALMESRGPSRYKNPFDLALLESQLGFIFSLAVKAHQPCFISSPEWQVLFPPDPVFPYHNSQPRSLTLRTQRWNVLAELPQLFIDFCQVTEVQNVVQPPTYQASTSSARVLSSDTEKLDHLALKVQNMLNAIQTWVESESEILHPDAYPDLVAAVLDCNASMSLITLTKMRAALQRLRSRSSSPEVENYNPNSMFYENSWMDDPTMVEYWTQRAIVAFEHVKQESMVACKVLEFGMEQLRLLGDKSEESESGCQFINRARGGLTPR